MFGRKVVFFGAHTDDEFVAAGTLHRLARSGVEVHVVTFAPAAIASDRAGGLDSVEVVKHEWNAAMDIIGVHQAHRLFLALMPSVDLAPWARFIRQKVFDYCEHTRPDAALVLSPEDENPAHAIVGRESEAVLRGRVPTAIRCIFPWNFSLGRPNLFVTLTPEDLEAKRRVIEAYKSQAFRYQYRELFEAYCRGDGLSVKREAAERFEIVRSVL